MTNKDKVKKKIKQLYIDAINEDLAPNVFADKILLLFKVKGSLPKGWISPDDELPKNSETVTTLSSTGKEIVARFELFLGNQIWESYSLEGGEEVVGWKRR